MHCGEKAVAALLLEPKAGVEALRTKCRSEIVSLGSSVLSSLRDAGQVARYFDLKQGVCVCEGGEGPE